MFVLHLKKANIINQGERLGRWTCFFLNVYNYLKNSKMKVLKSHNEIAR
jgi:hypothetical protein